ncbi:MAG TPA: hypothetical protein VH165_26595 [Kofleriaceae bacterium]|jgi:hypothetical protein|nr:hypothetical protein [Kofleriaceae bacterium]
MVRPRWHDALIVSAIVGLLVVGIWSLWGDDVRGMLHLGAGSQGGETAPAAVPGSQTSGQT